MTTKGVLKFEQSELSTEFISHVAVLCKALDGMIAGREFARMTTLSVDGDVFRRVRRYSMQFILTMATSENSQYLIWNGLILAFRKFDQQQNQEKHSTLWQSIFYLLDSIEPPHDALCA
jgi:hypothetical protein